MQCAPALRVWSSARCVCRAPPGQTHNDPHPHRHRRTAPASCRRGAAQRRGHTCTCSALRSLRQKFHVDGGVHTPKQWYAMVPMNSSCQQHQSSSRQQASVSDGSSPRAGHITIHCAGVLPPHPAVDTQAVHLQANSHFPCAHPTEPSCVVARIKQALCRYVLIDKSHLFAGPGAAAQSANNDDSAANQRCAALTNTPGEVNIHDGCAWQAVSRVQSEQPTS